MEFLNQAMGDKGLYIPSGPGSAYNDRVNIIPTMETAHGLERFIGTRAKTGPAYHIFRCKPLYIFPYGIG